MRARVNELDGFFRPKYPNRRSLEKGNPVFDGAFFWTPAGEGVDFGLKNEEPGFPPARE